MPEFKQIGFTGVGIRDFHVTLTMFQKNTIRYQTWII